MFFNEQGMLNLDEAVMNQPTFKKIMEDGIVTEQEIKEQSERIVSILKSMEKNFNYIPSKAYYEKLEAITPINAGLLALKEYKAFLPDAISAFSNKGKTVASSSTEQCVNYIDATIQDEKVAEFLIDQFVYNFVDNNGLDEADGLIVLFRKHVKDTKSIEKFNALCILHVFAE